MNRNDIYAIVSHYGREKQTIVAIEEMSELQKELCKALRGDLSPSMIDRIAEETADVLLMVDQVMMMYGIDMGTVDRIKEEKVRRTFERMGKC